MLVPRFGCFTIRIAQVAGSPSCWHGKRIGKHRFEPLMIAFQPTFLLRHETSINVCISIGYAFIIAANLPRLGLHMLASKLKGWLPKLRASVFKFALFSLAVDTSDHSGVTAEIGSVAARCFVGSGSRNNATVEEKGGAKSEKEEQAKLDCVRLAPPLRSVL